MAISLDNFRAYVNANQNLSDNQVVNIADRAEGKLGNRKCVALGFRDNTFKTQNLAARDAFLKAVLTRCHANSINELPPAVLKSLNIDKFKLDENGRVMSNKPLTMRRIKAVLTAIDNEKSEVRTERAIQALKPSITRGFSKSIGDAIANGGKPEDFGHQLKSCFVKHLSANTLKNILKNVRGEDGHEFYMTLANEIFQGTKDGLAGLTRNDMDRIGTAFRQLSVEIQRSMEEPMPASPREKSLRVKNDCLNRLMHPFLNFMYAKIESSIRIESQVSNLRLQPDTNMTPELLRQFQTDPTSVNGPIIVSLPDDGESNVQFMDRLAAGKTSQCGLSFMPLTTAERNSMSKDELAAAEEKKAKSRAGDLSYFATECKSRGWTFNIGGHTFNPRDDREGEIDEALKEVFVRTDEKGNQVTDETALRYFLCMFHCGLNTPDMNREELMLNGKSTSFPIMFTGTNSNFADTQTRTLTISRTSEGGYRIDIQSVNRGIHGFTFFDENARQYDCKLEGQTSPDYTFAYDMGFDFKLDWSSGEIPTITNSISSTPKAMLNADNSFKMNPID